VRTVVGQSRLSSLVESVVNILLGYGVAIVSQIIIFPFFDIHIPLQSNLLIGFWFTLVSLVRSYCIRRWFNWRIVNFARTFSRQEATNTQTKLY